MAPFRWLGGIEETSNYESSGAITLIWSSSFAVEIPNGVRHIWADGEEIEPDRIGLLDGVHCAWFDNVVLHYYGNRIPEITYELS